jgi:cell division septation protein DedD
MVRDWRSLALAVLAAAALSLTGVLGAEAQTPAKGAKTAPKTAPKPAPKAPEPADDDDSPEELKPEAKPKAKKQDPVEAQRAIEGALKSLESGKPDQAVQVLSNTISGGNLPPAIMAKALLYRGMAHRQQRRPAQAISDFTSALWLKGGLSPTDRTNAEQQRAAAYREAGLNEKGGPLAPGSGDATQANERPSRPASNFGPATSSSGTETKSSSSQSGSGWGNWFGGGSSGWGAATTTTTTEPASQPKTSQSNSGWGNWFGGGSSAAAQTKQGQPEQEVAPFATTVKGTAEPTASTSSWASGTEVRGAPAQAKTQRIETAAITSARAEGRFSVQVAMVRSQDEATAIVAKVKRDYAGALASREPEIDWTTVGNMGMFYRVRVGPFASQNEGQAVCARLKGSGLDCMVVTQ